MATYIAAGEADATAQGAEWLLNAIQTDEGKKKFSEQFKAVHTDVLDSRGFSWYPVFELFLEYSQDLFSAIPEGRREDGMKEVESFFALILSILLALDETDHVDKGTTKLCEILTSSTNQNAELRLRLLMNLYNVFPQAVEFRFRVFKYVIDYAHATNMFDQILPYLEYLDAWLADWEIHLKVEDKRLLFKDLAVYVRASGRQLDAFSYLKRYHQLFQGEAEAVLTDDTVVACTVQLLKDAVEVPTVIQFDDLLGFDTVKALSKSKKSSESGLVKLCEIFFSGSLSDMRQFESKNQALFTEHGLNTEDVIAKIKLLSLATMALHKNEMSLAEVATGLEESEEEVERWVIRAISEGIIDGRIDQLNAKVLVKSVFQRQFESTEWAFLDTKLSAWIGNLENVIKFIGEQKQAQAPPQPVTVN